MTMRQELYALRERNQVLEARAQEDHKRVRKSGDALADLAIRFAKLFTERDVLALGVDVALRNAERKGAGDMREQIASDAETGPEADAIREQYPLPGDE